MSRQVMATHTASSSWGAVVRQGSASRGSAVFGDATHIASPQGAQQSGYTGCGMDGLVTALQAGAKHTASYGVQQFGQARIGAARSGAALVRHGFTHCIQQ